MLGAWVSIPSTVIAEIVSRAGFDAVVVDIEHSAIELFQIESLFQAIEGGGSSPMARLSNNDEVQIKRVLDLGAHGIIVPMIKSASEARRAVEASKYPPLGFRSTGIYRAQNYGESFQQYRFSANDEVVVILQIEHKDAVENIENILAVPGIDGLMIGPYDLSSTYGIAGEIDHPVMQEAKKKVIDAAHKAGVGVGLHVVDPSPDKLKSALNEGFSFLIHGNDAIILSQHYNSVFKTLRG
jgi:2,4-dihydroxyhept-2-ene-1,7-dioic acid aldolase